MKKVDLARKEFIKLRQRELTNGGYSLYLDIYWQGQREYDFLNLYLNEVSNATQRKQNKDTLLLAEQIKAQRLIDLQNGRYKFKQSRSHESFLDHFKKMTRERYNSSNNYGNWKSALKHIIEFTEGKEITFDQIDEVWLNNFKKFLLTENLSRDKKKLSQNSAHSYYNKVRAALREAFEEKIIFENPAARVRGIKAGETNREYLDWEEIERIIAVDCDTRKLKEAFLFSVLTGLRWSDIIKLTWSELRHSETEGWSIRFQQKKTKEYESLPITLQARDLLGVSQDRNERVFIGLKYSAYTNVALSRWMLRAGIHKHITFHCARHTHATLLLSRGVDIYVVSKLLGHKHIKTTEIYTKVTNLKKNEAINKLPIFGFTNKK